MKFGAPIRILAVAILCVLALVGLVVREGMARASGTEAILSMEAVDPRSLLSGHYVIVNLREATTIPGQCDAINGIEERAQQDPRYDARWLALQDRSAQPSGATPLATARHVVVGQFLSRDEALRAAPLVVRGAASCSNPELTGDVRRPGILQVQLRGVDRFHVSQAEAQRIERILREQRPGEEARVFAIVSIGRDGRARLKGLIVDGARIELQWF